VAAAKTSMSSKIIGAHSEFFSNLAVDAVMAVKREGDGSVSTTTSASAGPGDAGEKDDKSRAKYPISAINIIKSHGRSSTEVRFQFSTFCASSVRPSLASNCRAP
jgi:T-complex protein 1 subunit alpha